MLHSVIFISVILASLIDGQRKFGEFRIKIWAVEHPLKNHTNNDVVNYRFMLTKTNKYDAQLVGKFEFRRKVSKLKVENQISKKDSSKMAAEYLVIYQFTEPKSFCFSSEDIFPVFQESLAPPIDYSDCSLDSGSHTLKNYFLEDELRRFVGNRTFYGDFRLVLIISETNEKNETNRLIGIEIFYSVVDADLAATPKVPQKCKSPRKNKETKNEGENEEEKEEEKETK